MYIKNPLNLFLRKGTLSLENYGVLSYDTQLTANRVFTFFWSSILKSFKIIIVVFTVQNQFL